jgi:hypothetical protein
MIQRLLDENQSFCNEEAPIRIKAQYKRAHNILTSNSLQGVILNQQPSSPANDDSVICQNLDIQG